MYALIYKNNTAPHGGVVVGCDIADEATRRVEEYIEKSATDGRIFLSICLEEDLFSCVQNIYSHYSNVRKKYEYFMHN